MPKMTREEAVAQYPWRRVSGDASTPQAFWHFRYYTDAEKRGIERSDSTAKKFGATQADLDGDRILGLLNRAAY